MQLHTWQTTAYIANVSGRRVKSKPEPHKIKEKCGIITTKWRRGRKRKERSSELAKLYVPSSAKKKRTIQQSIQKTAAPKRPLHPYLHN